MAGSKMTVSKTVDKHGNQVFTYLKTTAPPEAPRRRKRRREAVRITLKLPR